jgi:hypothetical protein
MIQAIFVRMRRLTLLLLAVAACYDQPAVRRRPTARADTVIPIRGELQQAFVPPPEWERIKLASGLQFSQPRGFTVGITDNAIGLCDENTPAGNVPVLATAFSEHWPLTVRMRRGERADIARANGFVLDSTEIVAVGQTPERTKVRRGEGWILLSAPGSLFGELRHPGGCQLVWAARGIDINLDTLGYVIASVRFGAPSTQP